jgi:hypothetical protein
MANSTQTSGGIGFFGLLAIVFITLKLLGKVTWTWWWVLSPIWAPLAVGLIFFGGVFVVILFDTWRKT